MELKKLLFLLILLQGCQTVSYQQVSLPINLDRMFATCSPGDGAILVKARWQDQVLFVTESDWLAKGNQWTIEAYNSFGQTMGSFRANEETKEIKLFGERT